MSGRAVARVGVIDGSRADVSFVAGLIGPLRNKSAA